ncbi:MAG TPA: VIT domain-containing protein [Planctomycetaceae bacterium]|nr:VIT domain-containing protein [Planctomycetaceae bacterium]
MKHSSELNQRLLELVYGLLPDDEAAGLQRRIAGEPAVSRAFDEAQRIARLLAEASRVEARSRSAAPPMRASESLECGDSSPLSFSGRSDRHSEAVSENDVARERKRRQVAALQGRASHAAGRRFETLAVVLACACALVVAVLFVGPSAERRAEDAAEARAVYPRWPAEYGLLVAQPRPQGVEQRVAAIGETLATGEREHRRVALPDGSVVYLNENTSLRVESERRVEVDRGEVFVEVAPRQARRGDRRTEFHSVQAERAGTVRQSGGPSATPSYGSREPFVVATKDRELVALGTKFVVAADEDGDALDLAVVQGRVRADGAELPVAAGQQLVAAHAGGADQPAILPAIRSSERLAWTRELRAKAEPRLVPASAHAGGALVAIDPNGQEMKLSLRRYQVDVHIEDGFARTTIDQTYFNHEQQQLEGTFYFPLPADASLSRLAMYVAGLKMEGGMVERDYARNVFEEIRYARRDPALLEWVDGSTFKMRVFPLEARHEKRLLLSYTQRLPAAYGRITYRFPAGHNLEVAGAFSTHIRLKGGAGLEWHSPSHELAARTEGEDLVLGAKSGATAIERDIVVEVVEVEGQGTRDEGGRGVESRESRVESRTGGESRETRVERRAGASGSVRVSSFVQDGQRYLMLRMQPDLPVELERPRRHWTILFEATGDRDPLLARVQIDAAETILDHAEHDDTFGLVVAGTTAQVFADEPLPCAPENIADAVAFLEQTHLIGALNLEAALEACAPLVAAGENPHLIHMGAGVPILGSRRTDELARRVAALCKAQSTKHKAPPTDPPVLTPAPTYVGVPVGHRWSREFMESAARLTGGLVWPINPDEDVSWKAFELVSTLNAPRLVDVRVADGDGRLSFLTFAHQLAQGEELCAVTRLGADEPLPKSLTVSGVLVGAAAVGRSSTPSASGRASIGPQSDGVELRPTAAENPWTKTFSLEHIAVADGAAYLPRFWAKLEIDRLLSEDAAGHKQRIVELSKSMYVMSPYTSLLVLESEAMYAQYNVDRGRSDHWAMYPAPEQIPVVYEPPVRLLAKALTADEPPVAAPTPAEDERRRLARSVRDVLESVVVRSPGGRGERAAIDAWRNAEILAALSDPVLTAPLPERVLGRWDPATTDLSRLTLQSDPRQRESESLDPSALIAERELELLREVERREAVLSRLLAKLEHDLSPVEAGRPADSRARTRYLHSLRNKKFLETLHQVELSHVPFPDAPPVASPSAELLARMRRAEAVTQRAVTQRIVGDELHAERSERRVATRRSGILHDPRTRFDDRHVFPGTATGLDRMRRRVLDEGELERDVRLAIEDSERQSRSDPQTALVDLKRLAERLRVSSEREIAESTRRLLLQELETSGKRASQAVAERLLTRAPRAVDLTSPQVGWGASARSTPPFSDRFGRLIDNSRSIELAFSPDGKRLLTGGEELARRRGNLWFDFDGDGTVLLDGLVPLGEDSNGNGRLGRHFDFYSNGALLGDGSVRMLAPLYTSGGSNVELEIVPSGRLILQGSPTEIAAVHDLIRRIQPQSVSGSDQAGGSRTRRTVTPYYFKQLSSPRLLISAEEALISAGEWQPVPRGELDVRQLFETETAGTRWGRADDLGLVGARVYPVEDLVLSLDPFAANPFGLEGAAPPAHAAPVRVFTDLAAQAPGLNTTWSDVAAVLDEQLARLDGGRASGAGAGKADVLHRATSGAIDPGARRLIDRTRNSGWEAVTLPGFDGDQGLTIVCDGSGRHVYERTVSEGLKEQVVCDGETLLHLYPEIGLGAQRTVSRFHRAEFRAIVPWLVPPVEDLARDADVRLVDAQTVAVVPRAAVADGAADSDAARLAIHLIFSSDGRLTERRLVLQPDGSVLVRWTFAAEGPARLLDANGTVLVAIPLQRKPAEAPVLEPDTSALVVLPLPYRSQAWVEQHVGSLSGGDGQPPADAATEAVRLAHVAAAFAADAPARLRSIVEREFFERGDHRLGFHTLLAGTRAGWVADDSTPLDRYLQDYGRLADVSESALAEYLQESLRLAFARRGATPERAARPADDFLTRLADTRYVYALWTSTADADRQRRESPAERTRAIDLVRRCRSEALAWLLANAVAAGTEDGAFAGQIADAARRFDHVPGLAAAARFIRAGWLDRAGRVGESRELLRGLYMDALARGVLLPADARFVAAVGETSETRRAWRNLIRELHSLVLEAGLRSAALCLALECRWMDDAALARTLFDRTLARRSRLPGGTQGRTDAISATGPARQAGPTDDPAFAVEAADALMAAAEFERADRLLTPLLDDERLRDVPGLWRWAAAAAHGHGNVAEAIVRVDRAVQLEFDQLPETIDLAAFREQYTNLLTFYQNAATAARDDGAALPDDFTALVLRAADRWRRIDPDDTAACQAAAKVLQALGHNELAWAYLTTPLGQRPNEAAPWTELAVQLQTDGRIDEAADAYATAFEIEPTNAQILWDHSQMLESAARPADAASLYRRLAEGPWQPRFQGLQVQAREKLGSK